MTIDTPAMTRVMLDLTRKKYRSQSVSKTRSNGSCHFANISGLSVREVILRLQKAGLDSIPGGGAEILTDRVRTESAPRKCTTDEWLGVMEEAHNLGMRTTATMMFGHIENMEERFEHLDRLRQL